MNQRRPQRRGKPQAPRHTDELEHDDDNEVFGASEMNDDPDVVKVVDGTVGAAQFHTKRKLPPSYFRDEQFARDNADIMAEYADYRVMGWNPERAFMRVFGTDYADYFLMARIEALEHNIVYRQIFAQKFAGVKPDEMFDVKMSVYELKSLVMNPFTKDSTRLAAIKELNVMFNITVVDENGKTRAGSALNDFYVKEQALVTGSTTGRHPDPGTPEAEVFMGQRDARIGKPS